MKSVSTVCISKYYTSGYLFQCLSYVITDVRINVGIIMCVVTSISRWRSACVRIIIIVTHQSISIYQHLYLDLRSPITIDWDLLRTSLGDVNRFLCLRSEYRHLFVILNTLNREGDRMGKRAFDTESSTRIAVASDNTNRQDIN